MLAVRTRLVLALLLKGPQNENGREHVMPAWIGQPPEALDSPQLIIDLDAVDANLRQMRADFGHRQVAVRVHFKSLKCAGLARYVAGAGLPQFVCAKLNEAEVLADAGLTDIFIANQIVGAAKLQRLAMLAQRAQVRVCVDDPRNVVAMSLAAEAAGCTIGVLVEVDIGMGRCGVEPGEPALALARQVHAARGLRFVGLQGYDGHLQLVADPSERGAQCVKGLELLVSTRRLIEQAGIAVSTVTGGGTGTAEFVGGFDGVTEIQPGSFILMDHAYHAVRPEYGCALSILATVISRRPRWYVLDAGSKAISRDFGTPVIKGRAGDSVVKLSEEHTTVQTDDGTIAVGDRVEVVPTHCCATMNLHRACVAVRRGRIEALWAIEASGRYD
jgi:D-serine deaminase-like pyridoxal phosphate-dependent protein